MKILLLLGTFTLYLGVSFSQFSVKHGSELGVAFSFLPHSYSRVIAERNDLVTETYKPVYSPLLGFYSQISYKELVHLSLGLQYQMTGQSYHYHREGNDLSNNATYRSDEWKTQTYHKFCLPLKLEISGKFKRFNPSIFLGLRLNYFAAGSFYRKYVSDHDIDSKDYYFQENYDPFDKNQVQWSAPRLQRQRIFGFSIQIHEKMKLSFTAASGGGFYFFKSLPSCYAESYQNNDFIATLSYKF